VYFGQLVFKRLKLPDPLLNSPQLLGNEHLQPGPHRGASFALKLTRQGPDISQGDSQSASAADEQQPIYISTRVLPVA
jgi:hemin uptake protein HemP